MASYQEQSDKGKRQTDEYGKEMKQTTKGGDDVSEGMLERENASLHGGVGATLSVSVEDKEIFIPKEEEEAAATKEGTKMKGIEKIPSVDADNNGDQNQQQCYEGVASIAGGEQKKGTADEIKKKHPGTH